MSRIEFFFDCSSPWTYLAFTNIQPLAAMMGEEITWRPILVGGVFNAVNQSVYERRASPEPMKAAYTKKDMQDWARLAGLQILWPPSIFPINSVKAMRACILADRQGKLPALAQAVFKAYWTEDQDIAQDDVLAPLVTTAGLDAEATLAGIQDQAIKDELKANTQEVMDRGGFGSPTIFVDKTDMYFGNDRLPLVVEALKK